MMGNYVLPYSNSYLDCYINISIQSYKKKGNKQSHKSKRAIFICILDFKFVSLRNWTN